MSGIYTDSPWMNTSQQDQLLAMFFQDSPIKIDWHFHNSQKVVGKQLVLGAWAGPVRCITHLIHEMCHLVEIDDKRILMNGWGLTTPEVYIPGRYSHTTSVPMTHQPSLRETRVIGLQWQVQTMLGIEQTPRETLGALTFMPDWCNVPHGLDRESKDFTMHEVDEARFAYLEGYMMEQIREKYSLDYFHQEWKRKNELLRRAMS